VTDARPPLSAESADDARQVEHLARSQAALQSSEQRLRLAMTAGELGSWEWDIAADRVTWSDIVYRMHGITPQEFGGRVRDFTGRLHPEDKARVERQIRATLEEGAPYDVEFRVVWPDGTIRSLATRAQVEHDATGKPVRMSGAIHDVTERVQLLAAERAARAEAERTRRRLELLASASSLLSGSLEPATTLRRLGEVLTPAVADWCRIDLLDADGKLVRGLVYHADPELTERVSKAIHNLRGRPETVGSMAWCVRTGQAHTVNHVTPEDFAAVGDPAMLEFARLIGMRAHSITPLIARGRTLGALAVVQAESGRSITDDDAALLGDIAQRAALALDNARLYSEAEAARREAERANRTKDEFLAMLGHELRNPLAPIVTTLKVMALRDDSVFREERRLIGRQIDNLARLVDDLLDVARIVRGDVRLRRERVTLAEVLARAAEMAAPLIESRGHALRLAQPPATLCLDGDAGRLNQVFANLLMNAARYTPDGGEIEVEVATESDRCIVTIADNGLGIEAELLPRIFDLFIQGRQGPDRAGGGLGVGLALVKNLVGLHGGSVSATSAGPGRGSVFAVTLPLAGEASAAVAIRPAHVEPAPAPRRQRVLVVDDNRDGAQALVDLLEINDFEVRMATDPLAGLALVEEFAPEVAILDIGLPQIDGCVLAGRIRATEAGRGCRLIALTGYGMSEDRVRTHEAGFAVHLVKPVDPDELLEAVRQTG
jgi:PAS domain S-box-containing protein